MFTTFIIIIIYKASMLITPVQIHRTSVAPSEVRAQTSNTLIVITDKTQMINNIAMRK